MLRGVPVEVKTSDWLEARGERKAGAATETNLADADEEGAKKLLDRMTDS